MKPTFVYEFEIPKSNGLVISIIAENEKSARRKLILRRNKESLSYAQCYQATIKNARPLQNEGQLTASKYFHDILLKETHSLKIQFESKCMTFAGEEHDRIMVMKSWTYADFITKYPSARWGKDVLSSTGKKLRDKVMDTTSDKRQYIENARKMAESHYFSSIEKLAFRLVKVGLNKDTIKMTTSHIGVNIDTIITDGNQTVHAYTIIASGPIQRPHYRYLIK